MKTNNKILTTATPALIAAAVLALSLCFPMNATVFVAYGCVLTLAAVLAIEYRVTWRNLFGR